MCVCMCACTSSLKTSVDEKLEFHFVVTAPSSQQSSNSHSIFLTNSYDYDLHFSITLSQPFFIVNNSRRSSTDPTAPVLSYDSLSNILLPPSHVLMLEIHFTPSEEMLKGFEDYKIENELLISFSNGFHQVVLSIMSC